MKLQFKTDDLLKKVEGLIIKDIAARKEHNRKVDIINAKVDKYVTKQKKQRQSEIEKAEAILAKYSDDELRDLFFEKDIVVHKGTLFTKNTYDTYKSKDDVVTIEGVDFKVRNDICDWYLRFDKDICARDIVVDKYWINTKEDLIHEVCKYKIRPVIVTHNLDEIGLITPHKECESPSNTLTSLRDKCLQAKQYDIEECILEDKDLTLLNYYSNVVYTPSLNRYQKGAARIQSLTSGVLQTNWTDIINEDELS